MFKARAVFLCVALLSLLAPSGFCEKPLTNDDVVKLTKLGLGDAAVVAKIRQSSAVSFRLETDDLVKLKTAGVSGSVIAAMLDRDDSGKPAAAPSLPAAERKSENSSERASGVKLVTSRETVGLTSLVGSSSSTWVYVTSLFWFNFPGLHATHRTADHSPAVLIATDHDPRSRYFVVRLDVNDKGGDRSLKMGKSGAFSFHASNTPDSEWTFPFEASEQKPGTWKLALKTLLPPGEYGVFVTQSGELYDFGVE